MTTNCVQKLREERGWTREELATRAGLTRQTVWLVERHKVSPTVEVAMRIASTLELPVDEVFQLVDARPTIVQRIANGAKDAAKGALTSASICALLFFAFLGYNMISADRDTANGNLMEAEMHTMSVNMLVHPMTAMARYTALTNAEKLHVGIGRGYLTPPPSKAECRGWLDRYGHLAEDAPYADAEGRFMHEAAADCLDRVGATEAAFAERQAIIEHPDFILARTDALEFYLYAHAAMEAHIMGDEPNAKRFLTIARTDHPAIYTRWFQRGLRFPSDLKPLQPVLKEI